MKIPKFLFLIIIMSSPLNAKEGVILLHGLCRSTHSMKKLESKLVSTGFYVKNISYPSRSDTIENLSNQAIGQALLDPELLKCSKIHFVTHSLGGMLVRSYLKRNALDRPGRVVMFGPPNKGSEVVDLLGGWWLFRKINGPAGSELGTGKDSAPSNLGKVNFELGVIAGDRSINWINSLMIKGKDDGKVSVENTKVEGMKEQLVLHVSHPYIMKNTEVIERTIHFLGHGTFTY